MEVDLTVLLAQSEIGSGECISCADRRTVAYKAPAQLVSSGFPVSDATFNFERVLPAGVPPRTVHDELLAGTVEAFLQRGQNSVFYSYGQKGTPKRPMFFGRSASMSDHISQDTGIIQIALRRIFELGTGSFSIQLSAFVLGVTENIVDLINPENSAASVADSVKDGPSITNLTRQLVSSYAEAFGVLRQVVRNVEEEFSDVLDERADLTEAFPPYNPCHIVFMIQKFPAHEESPIETNSLTFIALGDSERPPLCGINIEQLTKYEKTHKTHTAVVGVLSAIRSNRLRVPFTKSRLTSILKRAYNQEKNNPYNETNQPTKSFLFVHAFADAAHAEESYHTLITAKRISNVMGGGGVGPASRDLAVEKWRLEQDIVELKDELAIAKAVHDYKPCIFDQAKPVQNIQEEEMKRINAINKKREDARMKAQNEMRMQAQKEAQAIIDQEERKSNSNIKELEEKLKEKLAINAELVAERDKKVKEFDKQLEKIRKKKVEEEERAEKLREELKAMEDELQTRTAAIAKARQQLELLTQDHAKGREMILTGREETKEKRIKAYQQRRAQREQWLQEIEATNQKVLEQVRLLSKECHSTGVRLGEDGIGEEEVKDDIQSIQKFLPKLVNIDEPQTEADLQSSEQIRLQLEEYFESERRQLEHKLAEEQKRKVELEKAAEAYKTRITEHQARVKRDQLQDALKKERHLEGLVEQVLQYLEHGCRMTKIPNKSTARKRFFFISEDRKKILSCEMDEMGVPVNRKRPTTTVFLKDIKRVVLGQYTATFEHFSKGKKEKGAAIDEEEGPYNPRNTGSITPQNVGKYFYRSFSFEFKKAKTLDVITDTDSDFEAWMVALKRLLGVQSEWEKLQDAKRGRRPEAGAEPPPPIEWGMPLELMGKPSADKLSREEAQLCATNHITPSQFLGAKSEILQKAQTTYVTVYDVRTISSLDLPRSQAVYEYFLIKRLISSPSEGESGPTAVQV
eukprot:TRINITY_DN2741_c0_g1_i2.p1 TRINITY_DN2741_c0_g1~~TRINITY_DN2741_c0_g1_i2.p1  ORF type:complete len:973 (+),score=225.32 TRINITY_DN2741_c0_g1_i2:56-2974(+)